MDQESSRKMKATRLSARFDEALVMASNLHRNQKRKATSIPYIAHLLSVAALVLENGGTENEAIAALLHDAVEDQGGKSVLNKIERTFGQEVAGIVAGCSDSSGFPKAPWKTRKDRYLQHLVTADDSVILVSLADKLHNLRDILQTYRLEGERTWERFNGGKAGTLWYYENLVEIFSRSGQPAMAAELRRVFEMLLAIIENAG